MNVILYVRDLNNDSRACCSMCIVSLPGVSTALQFVWNRLAHWQGTTMSEHSYMQRKLHALLCCCFDISLFDHIVVYSINYRMCHVLRPSMNRVIGLTYLSFFLMIIIVNLLGVA